MDELQRQIQIVEYLKKEVEKLKHENKLLNEALQVSQCKR